MMTTVSSISQSGSKLDSISVTKFPNHSRAFINTVKDYFRLEKTSTATADGIAVIQVSGGGTGRWIRENIPAPEWSTQATWYIDPAAGNDENDGTASTTTGTVGPIKTYAEWTRRMSGSNGNVRTNIVVTVNQIGDCSEDIAFTWAGNGGTLIIQGVLPSASFTGTLSAVTNLNAATSTPTDATSTWNPTTELGRLVHDTTADRWAFIIKDLTGNKARLTAWASVNLTQGASNGVVSIGNAATSDAVSTYVLPKWTGHVNIKSLGGDVVGASTNIPSLIIQQLDWNGGVFTKIGVLGQSVSVQNCAFTDSPNVYGGRINLANCLFKSNGTFSGNFGAAFVQVSAGGAVGIGSTSTLALNVGSSLSIANQVCFQNCQLFFRGNSRIRWIDGAIFDTASPITMNQNAGNLDITTSFWGTGNTGVAVVMNRDTTVTFTSGAATMTGDTAGVDFSVAGVNTAWPFDPVGRVYTAAINCSWANVTAAYSGGTGFGGSLFDPGSGCRVGVNTV